MRMLRKVSCVLVSQKLEKPSTEESKGADDKDQKAEGDGADPDSKVIVSNSKRFIVNKVHDHQMNEMRIAEDEEEETSTSPDNLPTTSTQAAGGADSDEQRSVKSVTRPTVPINISDLQDKLSRLHTGQKPVGMVPQPGTTEGSHASSVTPTAPQVEQIGQCTASQGAQPRPPQQLPTSVSQQFPQQQYQQQPQPAQPPVPPASSLGQPVQQMSHPVQQMPQQQPQPVQQMTQPPQLVQQMGQQQLQPGQQQAQSVPQMAQQQPQSVQTAVHPQSQPFQPGQQLGQQHPSPGEPVTQQPPAQQMGQQLPQSVQQTGQQLPQPVQQIGQQQPQPVQQMGQQQPQPIQQMGQQQPQSVQPMSQPQAQMSQPQSVQQMGQQPQPVSQMGQQQPQAVQQMGQQQPQPVQQMGQQQPQPGQQMGQQQPQPVVQMGQQQPQPVQQMGQQQPQPVPQMGQQQPPPVQQMGQQQLPPVQQMGQQQPQSMGSQQPPYPASSGQAQGEVSSGQQLAQGSGAPLDESPPGKSLQDSIHHGHMPGHHPMQGHISQHFLVAMQQMFPHLVAGFQYPQYYPHGQFQQMHQLWQMYTLYHQIMQQQQHNMLHSQQYQPRPNQPLASHVSQASHALGSSINPSASSQGTLESGIYSPMRVVSPPRSPTISRRAVNEEGAGQEGAMDGGVAQGGAGHGKSKPELSNLLNLEQALIKTIHGNRKDMALVPPMPAPQPGVNAGLGEGVAETSDIYRQSDSDSAVRVPSVGIMSESSFIRGGPTESKSEPLLHHQGQHVVRSRFPVETVPCPLTQGMQLDTGSGPLTGDKSTEATKIKGRFKVTTTRDSKSQPDVSDPDLDTSSSAKQDGDDVANSASALITSHSTPSASSNKEEGSQSLPKKPSHVSSSNPCNIVFKLLDPFGRPINPEVNSLLTQRTNSAACLEALGSAEGSFPKQRSASLSQLPPRLCRSNDQLHVYGDGAYANKLGPSIAHAMTQSSPPWWGRPPSPDLADIATQTSPLRRGRSPFDGVKGTPNVVSKGCCQQPTITSSWSTSLICHINCWPIYCKVIHHFGHAGVKWFTT